MISVGQKVRFRPLAHIKCFGVVIKDDPVIGTVVMVNKKHSWFSVEYGEPAMRTSFKFVDIGDRVHIVKENNK